MTSLVAENADGARTTLRLVGWTPEGRAMLVTDGAASYEAEPGSGRVLGVDGQRGVVMRLVPGSWRRLKDIARSPAPPRPPPDLTEPAATPQEAPGGRATTRRLTPSARALLDRLRAAPEGSWTAVEPRLLMELARLVQTERALARMVLDVVAVPGPGGRPRLEPAATRWEALALP